MRIELDLACMQSWPRGCSDEAGEEADGGSVPWYSNASMHIHPYAPHRPRVAVLSSRIILVIVDSMGDGWCIGFGVFNTDLLLWFFHLDQGCSFLILAHVPGSLGFGPPKLSVSLQATDDDDFNLSDC